jgi:2-pyrone-4,6-dicarboxylate lactonase
MLLIVLSVTWSPFFRTRNMPGLISTAFINPLKSARHNYTDMIDVVRSIIEARPDRVIWGSNWPHAGIAGPMPHDADLLDFLLAAAPEEDRRKQILAENPANLYGWRPI